MALPNSGTCSYNSVLFASMYRSKMAMKPVKDSAGRALAGRAYDLEVSGKIAAAPGDTTDATMANLRQRLAMPAGELIYADKGFGDLRVNVPGGKLWDLEYGPWTEVMDYDPIGNDQAAAITWKCHTVVPCEENPSPRGVIEWCWTESWDIADTGLTTRTIEGHVVVQATRATPQSRAIPANADDYREKIVPELPAGYTRTQKFRLSEDKRRLDFTITDTELPYPLPDGLAACEVRQRASWKWRESIALIHGSISGTLTVPARASKATIWDKIQLIIKSRVSKDRVAQLAQGQANRDALAQVGALKKEQLGLLVIDSFELDDDVFGLSSSFNVSYSMFGLSLASIVRASGIWDAVPGTSFQTWRTSLQKTAFAPRGTAGLRFRNSDDAILDLCAHEDPREIRSGKPDQHTLRGRIPQPRVLRTGIPPEKSWIYYSCRVRLIENDRIARHKPLLGTTVTVTPPLDKGITTASPGMQPPKPGELGGTIGAARDTGLPGAGVTSATPDILQRVSAPSYSIILEGRGVRAGYMVPIPRLLTVGGVVVTQAGQDVTQEIVSSVGSVPIHQSTWMVKYLLPIDGGKGLPVVANPAIDGR